MDAHGSLWLLLHQWNTVQTQKRIKNNCSLYIYFRKNIKGFVYRLCMCNLDCPPPGATNTHSPSFQECWPWKQGLSRPTPGSCPHSLRQFLSMAGLCCHTNIQPACLDWAQFWRAIAVSDCPWRSTGDFAETASQIIFFICSILFLILPDRCCSKRTPVKSFKQISIKEPVS